MDRTTWYNHKGQNFRISKDSLEKIEKEGTKAGKYLTYDQVKQGWILTDIKNDFNAPYTWKYSCIYDDEFDYNPAGEISTFDCLAWSLGYIYTREQYEKYLDIKNTRK